ncbi:MAG: WG repeat-containing protein [Eubacteriales bacterium]
MKKINGIMAKIKKAAKTAKKYVPRAAAVLVFMLICAIVLLYREGYFDIAHITLYSDIDTAETETDKDKETETDTDTDVVTDTDTSTGVETTTDTGASGGDDNPDNPPEVLFLPYAELSEQGYKLSYKDWEPGGNWVLADAGLDMPDYFSSKTYEKYNVHYKAPKDYAMFEPVYEYYRVKKPAVLLYMGYIIVETDRENTVNIYSSEGKALGSYDETKIKPAYCRDTSNRPLFIYKDSYYYLDAKNKRFLESDYNPKTDSRGVRFDYTPDYGKSDTARKFIYKTEVVNVYEPIDGSFDDEGNQLAYVIPTTIYRFALANTNGTAITNYDYYGAYPFHEGRAAVVDADGFLYYINRNGAVAIRTGVIRRDKRLSRSVYDFYMEPLTDGEESIGFLYFEHGITRARVLSLDYYNYFTNKKMSVINDTDIMIYTNGKEFEIPSGYDVIAYSSGMILLKHNGKYGYMSYTGAWVVQPTLSYAEPFYEGLAVIGDGRGNYALIDTEGNFVIPYGVFSYISNASTGVIAAYIGEYLSTYPGANTQQNSNISPVSRGWHILYKMKANS